MLYLPLVPFTPFFNQHFCKIHHLLVYILFAKGKHPATFIWQEFTVSLLVSLFPFPSCLCYIQCIISWGQLPSKACSVQLKQLCRMKKSCTRRKNNSSPNAFPKWRAKTSKLLHASNCMARVEGTDICQQHHIFSMDTCHSSATAFAEDHTLLSVKFKLNC